VAELGPPLLALLPRALKPPVAAFHILERLHRGGRLIQHGTGLGQRPVLAPLRPQVQEVPVVVVESRRRVDDCR